MHLPVLTATEADAGVRKGRCQERQCERCSRVFDNTEQSSKPVCLHKGCSFEEIVTRKPPRATSAEASTNATGVRSVTVDLIVRSRSRAQ